MFILSFLFVFLFSTFVGPMLSRSSLIKRPSRPKEETMRYCNVVYDADKNFYFKKKSFKQITTIYSVKMSDTVSETSSDMSRHCCKCDLNDSIGYVRSITKNCRECQRMRFCLKNTIRLNLAEDVYDLVCSLFSCSKQV